MDAYVFQTALYCAECGEAIKARLDAAGVVDSGDSEDYPQGPYADGGGEADTPQHCDCGPECLDAEELPDGTKIGAFLKNPLTSDGVRDLREKTRLRPWGHVVRVWLDFYQIKPLPKEYAIKWSDRETTEKADRIACNAIDLSNKPSTRLWAVANEYGILGLVWASNIQDALDALVDEDLGAGLLVDEEHFKSLSEEEQEDLAYLGNADEPADLTNVNAWEVELTPELIADFRKAEELGCSTLADLDD